MRKEIFFVVSVAMWFGAVHGWAEQVIFEDAFDGASNAAPSAGKWSVNRTTALAPTLDGSGHLVMTGVGTWNDPAIESIDIISADTTDDWQIDFTVTVPEASIQYIGLFPRGTDAELSDARAFFLHPSGEVRVITSQGGMGLTSGGDGMSTDGIFAANTSLVLRMILRADGTLEWWLDAGSGFSRLTPVTDPGDAVNINTYNRLSGITYRIMIQANGYGSTDTRLILDQTTITNLSVGGPGPTPTPPPPASGFIFQDTFPGAASALPDQMKWRILTDTGSMGLDGAGNLVMNGAESWNGPAIETQDSTGSLVIPGDGLNDYTIEYRVVVPSFGYHYLGLFSEGGLASNRAFFLQGTTGGTIKANQINVTTSQGGAGGFGDFGIGTNSGTYPINTNIGLRIIIIRDGTLEWWYDDGSGDGYRKLTVTGGTPIQQNMLGTWIPGSPLRLKVDCNGWMSLDKRLILDWVTVYEGIIHDPVPNAAVEWTYLQ